MIALEIAGSLLVLAAIEAFSRGWHNGLWGLLALQVAIAVLALRGLWRLDRG